MLAWVIESPLQCISVYATKAATPCSSFWRGESPMNSLEVEELRCGMCLVCLRNCLVCGDLRAPPDVDDNVQIGWVVVIWLSTRRCTHRWRPTSDVHSNWIDQTFIVRQAKNSFVSSATRKCLCYVGILVTIRTMFYMNRNRREVLFLFLSLFLFTIRDGLINDKDKGYRALRHRTPNRNYSSSGRYCAPTHFFGNWLCNPVRLVSKVPDVDRSTKSTLLDQFLEFLVLTVILLWGGASACMRRI